MAKAVDKFKLVVSPLSGESYITSIDKNGFMTENRRKLERDEVLTFIHHWVLGEADRVDNDTISITSGGVPVLEIKINK